MADDSSAASKRHRSFGGLLGALALPPLALLGVALLTLLVWWYFDISESPLNPTETAVVALFLAVVTAACRAAWTRLRRHASPAAKRRETRE